MVGPQSCTCGRGPFCVHLLFVMLRVFQLSQTDGMITSRTLKNYEVEALLIAYQARRESQVHAYSARKNVEPPESSGKSQPAFSSGMEGSKSRKKAKRSIRSLTEVKDDVEEKEEEETKEEDVCPICLLEMSEGESLVTCVAGCQNSLHQHCMSIWAEECHRQSEPLVCPLCRFQWSSYQGSTCSVSRVHPDLASLEGTEGQGRSSCDGKCDGDDAVSAGLKPRVDDSCELSRAPSDDISCSCDSGILENLVTKCSIDDRMGSSSSGSGSRATTSLLPASCDPARVSCRIPCIPALSTAEEAPESVCVDDEHKNCRCSTEYLEGVHWIKGKLLGAGAYSSCYHVQDTKTGTLMAVKQLSFCRNAQDDQVKAIREIEWEIATMTQLEHAHVVRVYGASRRAKHFNLFAEWMAGGSVACLLAEYGAFSDAVVTDYVRQVLLGLVYLHDKKILHRDLKGANLLVDSTGQRLKIADFGIAARLAASATAPGEFEKQPVGTWAFMAPEVLRGEDYGRSCDIWAVGCCVIEMSSAQPPWGATDISNHFQLWWKIGNSKTPPPLPDRLCAELKNFAMQCMKMCPKERPAARELVQWPIFVDV
ncbi:PREDICTED: mitogen-activated protein kinase kinase kinase 1-like [Priapulus caudatus]|uniref:Mitogen-activated protein kinase kinase kinase 1-like n=1 Tax=Priapulus caudatus TaxID=37621 RepID=A0ABM1DQQ2_PRICU|nr:PREDICTED: mitogen-activated protein kinase kinase kinase 1-like [Priapulus caudatus]